MKKLLFAASLCGITATALCAPPSSFSRGQKGSEEMQEGSRKHGRERPFPLYNKKTEEKIEGEIVDIATRPSRSNPWTDVAIMVRTEKGTLPVILGPTWYVDEESGLLRPGREVKIIGSVITENGKIFMIARELKVDNHEIKFRDSHGYKLWTGWREG